MRQKYLEELKLEEEPGCWKATIFWRGQSTTIRENTRSDAFRRGLTILQILHERFGR